MTKRGAKTVVPKLRFPEFREASRWVEKPLGEQAVFHKGRGISKADLDVNGALPCIRYGELYTRYGEVIDAVLSKTSVPVAELFLSRKHDVIIPASGETKEDIATASCILLDDVALGSDLNVIRSSHNGVFLSYFLNGAKRREIARVAQGNAVVHLYPSQLGALHVSFPEEAEQQRIADCLTSLDEVIAAQVRKVEALKAHKRGLMQQLFPREGEVSPRLRFPEFSNAPIWKEKKLGELASIVRGGSPRPIDAFLTSSAEGLNWLKIGDVDREAMYVTRTEEKVRPEALSKTRVIQPGDFILSNSMSFGRPYISKIKTCIHDGWIAVTRIPDGLNREFLFYSILSERSQAYFVDQAAGSGVQNLNKDIIKLLVLGLPSVEEQSRIASCLSSLDTQITAESAQFAALKTHKQGLMQQLFPAQEAG